MIFTDSSLFPFADMNSKLAPISLETLITWGKDGTRSQFSSVAQLCPTLCDPMECSMPGSPVHHQLPELTQTLFHGVGDAIQPTPLSSPSPPAFSLS